MKLVLERNKKHPICTIGTLFDPATHFELVTLENSWKSNGHDSSIPPGIYICKRVISPRFHTTFEVCDVPNRTHILFHAGNSEEDTLGCILLGKVRSSETTIGRSREAFTEFMAYMHEVNEFELDINDQP